MFPNPRVEIYYQLSEDLLNFAGACWWIIDLEDDPNIFYCNQTMCRTFGLNEKYLQHSVSKTCPIAGDYNTNIAIKNSDKAKQVFKDYHLLCQGVIKEYANRFPYYDEYSDELRFFSSKARVLIQADCGKASLLFGIIEPEVASAELYKQAKEDGLTGLYNRREFDSQLAFLINLAKREQRYVSLIMCDIDYFKQYNDQLGHYAGDQCLIKVSQAIKKMFACTTNIVCRYGGEEFAVISYGDATEAATLAEDIRRTVLNLDIPHPATKPAPVTVSVGYVSIMPDAITSSQDVIEKADKALYQAKHYGRNRCVQFD